MAAVQVATVRPSVGLSLFTDFENSSAFRPAAAREQLAATLFDHVVAWSGALRRLREPEIGSDVGVEHVTGGTRGTRR
jgi:hypothetical protein